MLQLNHEDVAQLPTPAESIHALRAGLQEQAEGQVQLPARTTTDYTSGKGWLRLMPVIMNGSGYMGFKAMHSTPKVDTQVTLFKSVGTALQDVSLAIAISLRAQERHVGQDAGEFPHVRPFGRQ